MGIKWQSENGIDDGLDESTRNEIFAHCEDMCGSGNCDHFDSHNFLHSDNCDRTGFHH